MTSTTREAIAPQRRINSQHLAWGVLLIAFAIFCAICIIAGLGVNYFLFQSTLPMESSVLVGRGTASVQGVADSGFQAVQGESALSNTTLVKTDSQSQVTLFFRDNALDGRLIAAVTLKPGASLTFNQASRPRFDWSTVSYRIDLGDVSGDVDIYVPPALGRSFWMSLQTPDGNWVYLTDSGEYTVSASRARVQVINNGGNATLIAADHRTRSIPAGQKGTLNASDGDIALSPGYADLLQNSIFASEDVAAWGCSPGPNDQSPPSHYGIAQVDGRPALRLVRDGDSEAHGEIFCTQTFGPVGQVGLDVSGYSYLELKVTFYIRYQSLDACGFQGSECPLMLRLNYIDTSSGSEIRNWIHGFYTRIDPQLGYPTRCNSCSIEHESVYPQSWYTYDSGNLLNQMPRDELPRLLNNIQFYASGHRYDVYISEVALLAGQVSSETSSDSVPPPPTEESAG